MTNYQDTDRTLENLIRKGEGETLDFKMCIDDQKKIARTLVAFANTVGGSLLIGVKDNGKVSGIDPSEEYHMISASAELYCQPPVLFDSRIWQEKHKLVLEIIVKKSDTLHRALDEEGHPKIYIRRNDVTLQTNKIITKYLSLLRNGATRPEHLSNEAIEFIRLFEPDKQYTLSKLYRISSLQKKEVDHYLPLFLAWGLVRFDVSESKVIYFSDPTAQ